MENREEDDLRLLIQKLGRRIRNNRGDERLGDSSLAVLFHLETLGPQTPGALAEQERLTPPSMNRTLNGLESAALVRRDPSADDARKVLVSLTRAGESVIRETRRLRQAWFSGQLAALDEEELATLAAAIPVLRKLADT